METEAELELELELEEDEEEDENEESEPTREVEMEENGGENESEKLDNVGLHALRVRTSGVELPSLTVKEKKELASYAHSLGKKLKSQLVGKSGVTANVATSFVETLEANELLKVFLCFFMVSELLLLRYNCSMKFLVEMLSPIWKLRKCLLFIVLTSTFPLIGNRFEGKPYVLNLIWVALSCRFRSNTASARLLGRHGKMDAYSASLLRIRLMFLLIFHHLWSLQ